MSNHTSVKIEKIENIKKNQGKRGLRILAVFKALKTEVKKSLGKQFEKEKINIDEDDLNRLCVETADEIVKKGGEEPTPEDIQRIINEIVEKSKSSSF